MLQFILGALVGGVVGFATCAICSMARAHNRTDSPCCKSPEDSAAQNES